MKCPKCGTVNPPDSKFCKECATPFSPFKEISISRTKTVLPPTEDLTTGAIFAGRYLVIEELGHGGMGKVYKVLDKETNSKVALKVIKPEAVADKNSIERFRNELKTARGISHKHICRMYDLGRDADRYFITMEYVPGEDLRSLIRTTKRLDMGTAISIAKQVCEGLAEAHRAGVVHRDLKPSNIMIDREGEAKIMDFGIARSLRTKGITGPGVAVGTPEYMSPEQVEGKEADQRSDLYALSIIIYEMVTGTVPFEGETPFAIGLKHKSELPENPKKLNPQIPDDLGRLILKGLEKDKEKRYQTAEEVLSELTRIEQGFPSAKKVMPPKKPLTSREITVKFSVRKLIVPAIAVVAVAIAAVLLVLRPGKQPSKQLTPLSEKQLTFTGDAMCPAISPDGKLIAYMTVPVPGITNVGKKVWVQDTVSGRSNEVFSGDYCESLRWTPDGSEIAFRGAKDSKDSIFFVPRLGGPPRQIETHNIFTFSPDGSQYAIVDDPFMNIIVLQNKATGKSKRINLGASIGAVQDIDWSPRGDRLLVLTMDKAFRSLLVTIRTDGTQQNTVVEDNALLKSPRWSSKGDALLYLRGQGYLKKPVTELWRLPISKNTGKAAKAPSLVRSGISMGRSFSISADGKCFLYTRASKFSNLWLVRIEGSEKNRTIRTIQLTSGTSLHAMPRISPDKKFVAFARGTGEIMNIYVMPIEGGNPTQLTFFNSKNVNPAWSPDGTEIAFGSNEGGTPRVWKVRSQGGTPYQFSKTHLGLSQLVLWAPGSEIIYFKTEERNWQLLDSKTEEETPLVKDESDWMDWPVYSPNGEKIAVSWNRTSNPGLWVISFKDRSEKFLGGDMYPFDWSPDGKWVYAYRRIPEFMMIEVESGKTKHLPAMPFTIEGKANYYYYKVIEDKPEIFVDEKTQSDVWVIENFDQIIR